MATNSGHGSAALDAAPIWWIGLDQVDWLAWSALVAIALMIYLVVWLYAKFDKWAEHKSEGTPLAKTIPTLLTIALLYEIFPLDHFSALLPISAILLAVVADWMHIQEENNEIERQIVAANDRSIKAIAEEEQTAEENPNV